MLVRPSSNLYSESDTDKHTTQGHPFPSEQYMMSPSMRLLLFIQFFFYFLVTTTLSAPIIITRETFRTCRRGSFQGVPADCCPPKEIKGPIVDFSPKYDPSKPLRVRKALQCLRGNELRTYRQKLRKGYALMKALPDSDPRSFKRQNEIHCAYGTGSFIQDGSNNLTMDIHLNWFFLPWHRIFIYFHERILQKLLKDPTFTLHFWNFDNSVTVSTNRPNGCYKAGHFMPDLYTDPSLPTFESNRSFRAFTPGRAVDLSFDVLFWDPFGGIPPNFPNYTLQEQVYKNREAMHRAMITEGYDADSFIGRPYRVGDQQIIDPHIASGSQEKWPHVSLHTYIGGYMFPTQTSPLDPVFYPFHANMERLWHVWRKLGGDRYDPTDPDWLNTEWLMWDENKVMRKVKVKDLVDIRALGYAFENVNDASWIFFDNSTSPAQ